MLLLVLAKTSSSAFGMGKLMITYGKKMVHCMSCRQRAVASCSARNKLSQLGVMVGCIPPTFAQNIGTKDCKLFLKMDLPT